MAYNVLFISHERKMGGANHSLVELVKGLRDLGHNISVVVLYRGCPIDKKLCSMGIETFPCFFGWWQQPKNWNLFFKLAFKLLHWLQWIAVVRISGYVKRKKIDIIHSNSSVIDIGAQVAQKTECKHVWHFREYGEADYRLEYMFGKEESMNYVSKYSDMIIFISNALYSAYAELKDSDKVRVIYDGIVSKSAAWEEDILLLRKDRERNDKFTFLVTGNLSQGKNQMLVIEATNILISQMGVDKKSFQVYFAGAMTSLTESRKYMQGMQEYISVNNLDNIVFWGYVEDMSSLREKVHAEIIPSKSEAYGRVTLEAMLNHNLVIASESGANPELIENNKRGILFEKDNANDLANKMLQAMKEDNELYIEKAFEYVKSVHIQEDAYQKVQSAYQDIMVKGKD